MHVLTQKWPEVVRFLSTKNKFMVCFLCHPERQSWCCIYATNWHFQMDWDSEIINSSHRCTRQPHQCHSDRLIQASQQINESNLNVHLTKPTTDRTKRVQDKKCSHTLLWPNWQARSKDVLRSLLQIVGSAWWFSSNVVWKKN